MEIVVSKDEEEHYITLYTHPEGVIDALQDTFVTLMTEKY